MKVLLSLPIDASQLTATNAPQRLDGQTEWADGVYAAGDVVTMLSTGRVYRAVYAVKAGDAAPDLDIANNQIPKWQDFGPMNQMGAFDGKVSTETVGPTDGNLEFTVLPGRISSVWIGGISRATSAHVVVRDGPGGDVVYDETRSLHATISSWFEWWFAPFSLRSDILFSGIGTYVNPEVTITLESAGAARIGMIAFGSIETLGDTLGDPSTRYVNYSAKKLDDTWGPSEGTGGVVTRDQHYTVLVKSDDAPSVSAFMLRAMRAPGVWIPDESAKYEGLRSFGQAVDSTMGYPDHGIVQLELNIRGFI